MLNKITVAFQWRWQRLTQDTLFDLRHGLQTRQVEEAYLNDIKSDYRQYCEPYQASRWRLFNKMLKALPIDYAKYTFYDAGCGKGRALLFSSKFKFKKAIGVEISADLLKLAQTNIDKYLTQNSLYYEIELVNDNVLNHTIPDQPLVVFLYNPFNGLVLSQFIEKLAAQHKENGQPLFLVYMVPACREIIENQGNFRLYQTVSGSCIYEFNKQAFNTNLNQAHSDNVYRNAS